MSEDRNIEIDITSEKHHLKGGTTRNPVKRFVSHLARKIGLEKVAETFDPDTKIIFEEPIDPALIKTKEDLPISPQDINIVENPPIEDDIVITSPTDEHTFSEDNIDFSTQTIESTNRAATEIPTNTKIVGEIDQRPNFERTIFENIAISEMTGYLRGDSARERSGIIVGQFCQDTPTKNAYTHIQAFIPNDIDTGDWGRTRISPEGWTSMQRKLDEINRQTGRGLVIVGWVHSHPTGTELAPLSDSPSEDQQGFGDRRIIKGHFANHKFLTVIYGNGGSYDNQYALWRNLDDQIIGQTGFEINQPDQNSNYGYYTNLSGI